QFNLSIDYIIFLDSDDFWELNCIEECIKHMSNVDIVWFDYKLHYDLEYKYAVTLFDLYKFQKDMIISSEKWLKLSFKNEISEFWFTWQGMINFKKLDDLNIYFKKGILYEDQVFGILLFGQVNSIYVLVKTLLNYRIRLNSSMNYDRETKQYSSYFNGLSKTNINNIKKSFEYDINITNKYLQIARICNTYLTINKIIQNKNIFHLFKQVFLNKYLERSVQIFNFKEDPLGIKHTLAGEIDKEIDNFFILPPQDKLSHIPIVFSCDANYFSYLTVVLQSIKEKSSENYNYDIYILHNKLD
ncbi:hypothetical protein ACL6O1_001649, partial [Campylobacter jejuni]